MDEYPVVGQGGHRTSKECHDVEVRYITYNDGGMVVWMGVWSSCLLHHNEMKES